MADVAVVAFVADNRPAGSIPFGVQEMSVATVKNKDALPGTERGRRAALSDRDQREMLELYEAMRRGQAKLAGRDGAARPLPNSLTAFLVTLADSLKEGKPVYIVQNHAKLTTIEAAGMLGVSRQFLVNLLKKEEIPYHMVGTHRRIYVQDLLRYKAKRDEQRHKILRKLAQAEAAQGTYDKIPAVLDED